MPEQEPYGMVMIAPDISQTLMCYQGERVKNFKFSLQNACQYKLIVSYFLLWQMSMV